MTELKYMSDSTIEQRVDEGRVFSEELGSALAQVKVGSLDLQENVKDIVVDLLKNARDIHVQTGEKDNNAFGNRENIGIGIKSGLRGDLSVLDRFVVNSNGGTTDKQTVSAVKALRAELKLHCFENDIAITREPAQPAAYPSAVASAKPAVQTNAL